MKINKYVLTLLILHVLLLLYSFGGCFSKYAAKESFLSAEFLLLYGGMLAVLAIYAVGWQQVIKRLPLTTAFANKAITVVWGIMWGAVFFNEKITAGKLLGAALIVMGIVLFVKTDAEEGNVEK